MVLPFLAAVAPFAPIIGGALGALGSLFAPKPKPQTVKNSIDLKKLRDDAEAAGFNPLTVIRGGGLAGYGTQTMSAAPDMRLSNALQTFGSGIANWSYDPYGEAKSLSELRLAEAQIQSYARQGKAPGNLSLQTPKASGVSGTSVTEFGITSVPSPWFSDMNDAEQRWGDSELLSTIFGLSTLVADAGNTALHGVGGVLSGWDQALRRNPIRTPFDGAASGRDGVKRKPIEIEVRGGAR